MIDDPTDIDELAALVELHLAEIADSWTEKALQVSRASARELWTDILSATVTTGLRAVVDVLHTGSADAAQPFLVQFSAMCLRSGFENSSAIELLLLCKAAILPVIVRSVSSLHTVETMVLDLDTCLRWIIRDFNTLYVAGTNRRLREQHQRVVSMLRMGASDPASIITDEVLRQVGEGIMIAAEVDHCDFYMRDENQRHLTPRLGVRKTPLSQIATQFFMNTPPDLTTDVFMQELLDRKEPLVSYNALVDTRTDKTAVEGMGSTSVLAVPLLMNGRVFAIAVTGTFYQYRTFTEEQVELAWDIARAATLVLENSQLQQQSRHIAALEERERLAREIHDNLAQALSILKLQASNIDDLINAGQIDLARTFLTEMKNTATEAHTDAREAILGLRNSASTASELLPTIRAWLDKFRRTNGIDTRLIVQDEILIPLPPLAVIQLTRILQEALTNVRKHARAEVVWVTLERDGGSLITTVEDDGVGFDAEKVLSERQNRVGLQIMRERVEGLGGSLRVETGIGQGTRVVIQIPLAGDSQ